MASASSFSAPSPRRFRGLPMLIPHHLNPHVRKNIYPLAREFVTIGFLPPKYPISWVFSGNLPETNTPKVPSFPSTPFHIPSSSPICCDIKHTHLLVVEVCGPSFRTIPPEECRASQRLPRSHSIPSSRQSGGGACNRGSRSP